MNEKTRRTRTKKEVVSEFRTGEILNAARVVFAKKGFHAATVDEIARQAGVAKGTVYLYYSSKNDIYWAALKHGAREMQERLREAVDEAESVREKLRRFIQVKLEYYDEHRDFFKIYLSEFGNAFSYPALQKEFKVLYRQQTLLIRKVLQAGTSDGSVRRIPMDGVAQAIADLTRNVGTHRVMGWSRRTVRQDVEFVFDLMWQGIQR